MRFDLNGQPLWTNDLIYQNIGKLPIILRLHGIPDGQGGVFIAWMDARVNNLYLDPVIQHIDSSGAELFPVNGVCSNSSGTSMELNGVIPMIHNGAT
jgi:hypothetical protein